jgi:hypothetical protein
MNSNLEQLQTFLNQSEIPKIKGKPKTFLGIAKQPHYENVLSNIYAFYFNVNEVHKFEDLFVCSLLALINKDAKHIDTFFDFDVFTEYGVSDQKRIDLLLQNKEQAIIIENKVYHHLNNDLELYYNDVEATSKIGIVLSLHPISNIKHPHFINITHLQLLNRVMQNLESYLQKANDKYLVFLRDFYQNTINLSHAFMEKDDISFYYKNQPEINQLVQFKFKLREHIISEVVKVGETLDNINKYEPRINSTNNKRLVYYVSPKHKNLMITVVYEELLKPIRKMHIAIEMQGVPLKERVIFNELDTLTKEEKEIAFSDNFRTTDYNWTHFSVAHYYPSDDEITNLSEFIIDKLINHHFLSIFRKLETFLDTKK